MPVSQTKLTTRFGAGLLAAVAQRRGEQRAGRRAAEDALARAAARARCRSSRRRRSNRRARTPERSAIAGMKSSPMPSTAHEPALPIVPLRVYSATIEPTGSASTNASAGCTAAEVARQAGQRAAASRRRPTIASTSWPVCCQISGPVLVSCASGFAGLLNWSAKNAPGIVARERAAAVLVVVGVALADVGARDVDLGAHRLQVQHLLGRHLVGHDQHDAVALRARHQRAGPRPVLPAVASTTVPPGCRRPSRSAASIIARPMRSLIEPPGFCDSSFRNSVHGPVSKPRDLHQRRAADQLEHGRRGSVRWGRSAWRLSSGGPKDSLHSTRATIAPGAHAGAGAPRQWRLRPPPSRRQLPAKGVGRGTASSGTCRMAYAPR